ncbi:TPA: hypothetical protein ACYIZW_001968 [Staphylococcus pseudintermedius]|nr:hypothetical protein [Staphylococcus pseudintermedius]
MSTLGIKRLDEINSMTLAEYHYRVFAQEFIELKNEYERVKQAFLIRYANATKNVGTKDKPKEEYYFKSEDDILNYKECYYKLWNGENWGYTQEVEKVSEDDYKLLSVISDINNML